MKNMKKFVALVVVVLMLFSISSIAFAEDGTGVTPSDANTEGITSDASDATSDAEAALSSEPDVAPTAPFFEDSTITLDSAAGIEDTEELVIGEETEAPMDESFSTLDQTELDALQSQMNDAEINDMNTIVNPKGRAYGALYGSFNDAIATTGTIQPYGVFTLAPNQILQASLDCPTNDSMDYDIYIAEVTAEGTVGTLLTTSQYGTLFNDYPDGARKTVEEGTSYINTSTAKKNYAILVHAKAGANASFPYTLHYAIDIPGNYNANEQDQNAATPLTTLKFNQYVSGVVLNSPADQDWFAIDNTLGNAYEWIDIDVQLTNPTTGAKITTDSIEVYKHVGNNKMQLVKPASNGYYRFTPSASNTGAYYVRVTPKDKGSFDWHQYKINLALADSTGVPATITFTNLSTALDPNGIDYVTWPELGYAYCLNTYTWFEVQGLVKDYFGKPCKSGVPLTATFNEAFPL